MVHSPQTIRTANSIGRWKRRANTAHRKPPPNVKEIGRDKKIEILRERDGDNCACGCGKPLDFNKAGAVQVDHKVPLFRVAHLPDEQRAWYFGLDNQGLYRTAPCHRKKSAKEMTEKAHQERLTEKAQRHQERMAAKYSGKDDE